MSYEIGGIRMSVIEYGREIRYQDPSLSNMIGQSAVSDKPLGFSRLAKADKWLAAEINPYEVLLPHVQGLHSQPKYVNSGFIRASKIPSL